MKDGEMKKDRDGMNMDSSKMDMSGMDEGQGGIKMDHEMAGMDMSGMDHGKMGHDMAGMDMGGMDMSHGNMMDHGGHMMNMGNMNLKLKVSIVLLIPIILIAPIMSLPPILNIPFGDIISLILGSVIFFYCGTPFFSGAKGELQSRKPAMMMLVTMGISVMYVYSIYAFIAERVSGAHVMNFWFELATLIVIMLIGHIVEMNAMMRAGDALKDIASLVPKKAHRTDGSDVDLKDVKTGDALLVKENERIPADGTITSGQASIDESMITGESKTITKNPRDQVFGGSLNKNQPFEMTVTATGGDSFLSQVAQLVKSAQGQKSAKENLADRVASWLFWAALSGGVIAFIVWIILGGTQAQPGIAGASMMAVSVFVIACPHALGLAVPLVVARLTNISAKNGLLIQNRTSLEKVGDIRYALMDKTGTLTDGKFIVRDTVKFDEGTDVLGIMAALEGASTHPLAQAIVLSANEAGGEPEVAENIVNLPGVGLSGTVAGVGYTIVNQKYLTENKISFDQSKVNTYLDQALTVSFLIKDKEVLGFVALGDSPKEDSKEFIKGLLAQNITPVMLTGDNKATAQKVATNLGISEFRAELKPEDKAKIVAEYQAKGGVLFIGDGVNDSPALATADLGIAIGSGTSVAISTADVVLVNSNPSDVLDLLEISKRSNRKMVQNLWWGAGYNILAIPLAAGALASIGLILNPLVAAVLMSMSTIIVSVNAMGLKYKRDK